MLTACKGFRTMELTKEDVARLLTDPSPQTRADVASKIGHRLDDSNLSEAEIRLAQDIVRHMANDIAVQVRMSLAISVKKADKLPHDVAMKLAKDVEQVSLPVLEFSTILSDDDLIDIIGSRSPEKQEAIARREKVSEKVSEAIVEQGGEKAVTQLLNNRNAAIPESSLTLVTERFSAIPAVEESLVKRDRLPLAVAERLVGKVSEALREYLVSHHKLPESVVKDVVMRSREQATANLLGNTKEEQDIVELAHQLKRNGTLSPSLIIRGLCVGDVAFMEAAFSALAGIPITNVRVLIHDAGRLGLKSLYDKTGLPQGMYAIIRVALEVVKETQMDGGDNDRDRYRARVIERILTQYENFNPDDLAFLLDRLDDLLEKDKAA
jgi:uncharacterized protein (DUF2336 family)